MEELRQMVGGRGQSCRHVQMEKSSLPAREQDMLVRKRQGQNQEISPRNNAGESGMHTQTI